MRSSRSGADASALRLAHMLKRVRPELDLYLMSNRNVEAMAGNPEADVVRRIFYSVEELLELHLAILEGVQDRYDTPFFDNLKKYAQRPIGTFHALPIARGKSIFKSDWIRDMGEFYGLNLFLAESSATTGGLDSLLEPTGNIKKAQDKAARAFGADRVFFVTNGTSTSNKMAVQALLAPGDIAIVDRNCHKSHHYGMVLAGAQPLYVEAFPMTEYSMYGAVPLKTIKQALLNLKADGRLDRVKMVDLTNCTFDGHIYNTRRVMEECLAIKPDLIFLWDEAWFGFARFSPFLRPRTAMGAANDIEAWMHDPKSVEAYEKQQAELGDNPSDEVLLEDPADPRSAARSGCASTRPIRPTSRCRRCGRDRCCSSRTSNSTPSSSNSRRRCSPTPRPVPNQQLIASLDVARRQMELEGYGLVANAIEVAFAIRQAVDGNPLISKYFQHSRRRRDGAGASTAQSGFIDYPGARARTGRPRCQQPAGRRVLPRSDPHDAGVRHGRLRRHAVQGHPGEPYNIQLNKTSRNSVLLQSNINNTRSDVAHLIRVLAEIAGEIDRGLDAGRRERAQDVRRAGQEPDDRRARPAELLAFPRRVPAAMPAPRPTKAISAAASMPPMTRRAANIIRLADPEIDRRLKSGPDLVSASFVIPYPPGFPIMVPGQVITQETIDFMRKLDVKEIHGYDATEGLKLVRPEALAKIVRRRTAAASDRS